MIYTFCGVLCDLSWPVSIVYITRQRHNNLKEIHYRETRVHRPAGRGRSAAQAVCDWGCSSDCRDRRPIGEEEAAARGWARPCDWLTGPEEEEKEERRSGERKVHPVQPDQSMCPWSRILRKQETS